MNYAGGNANETDRIGRNNRRKGNGRDEKRETDTNEKANHLVGQRRMGPKQRTGGGGEQTDEQSPEMTANSPINRKRGGHILI